MVTRKQEPQIPPLEVMPADPLARAKPDGSQDPAGEAGWFLQREREMRGLTLEEAGTQTGIHPYHLEAMEYGDMTRMPTRADALEMIGAYANFLGFEPEPLLEHYVTFLPQPALAPRHHPANPAPLSSAKVLTFGKFVKLPPISIRLPNIPGGNGGLVASVTAAFLLFSGLAWMFVPANEPGQTMEQIADNGSDPMPTASTGPETAEVKITETPIDGAPLAAVDPDGESAAPQIDPDIMGAFIQKNLEDSGEGDASDGLTTGTATDIPPPEALMPGLEGGRIYGAEEGKARVVLKATRSIWLLIEDGKGNRIATQLLSKGDIYRVPDTPGLVATVQDGGAITYMIDGEEKGVLGEPGSVLAAEPLDVKKLEARGS
jgi:cytoskeleton protein RodZ